MRLFQAVKCHWCSLKLECLAGPSCIHVDMFLNLTQHRIRKFKEKFWFWLAWHLPKKLIYFATIRLLVHATTGKYSNTEVPELNAIEALRRFENG
jgi:hypothetical protein